MAIDFPASPAVGQRYAFNGVNYVFTAQGVWSISSTGAPAISTSVVSVQKFTTSSAYTPTPGTQFAVVECVGGGAGGGGVTGVAGGMLQGGGGGAGGYSRRILTAAQIGTTQAVTIGAGGAGGVAGNGTGGPGGQTSFGSLCVANGGLGGGFANTGIQSGPGGAGGAAGTGDIAAAGAPGVGGFFNNTSTSAQARMGSGGSSAFGGGGVGINNGAGTAASAYGSGGAGGTDYAAGASLAGGAGSAGICIVTEYNIAAAGPQGPVGPAGGTTGVSAPQGRLTFEPTFAVVMTQNYVNQGTIYYRQYVGDRVPIFNGSTWTMMVLPTNVGLSCLTSDTVKNPNAVGNAKINDWFVWNDGGTLRLSHGFDWPNDTGRFGNSGIGSVNGIWMNASDITNGPLAARGTWVGTTRSNASGNIDWILGSLASLGGPAVLSLWNAYNRVDVSTQVSDSTASWASTNPAFHPANNSTNMRVSFVCGLAEEPFTACYYINGAPVAGGNTTAAGVGFDTTTAYSGYALTNQNVGLTPIFGGTRQTAVGFHFFQAVEASQNSGSFLANGSTAFLAGLVFDGRF